LVDSIGKKITVVNEAVAALGLKNITTQHARAEAIKGTFDFIVSRAVAPTGDIIRWTKKYLSVHHFHEKFNGWLLLKGGDLKEELSTVREQNQLFSIPKYFNEPFFEEKFVVYVNNKNIPTFTKKKKIWG
jgi:16S rRNA (guanine527-N7)-methyltransferase